MIIGIFASVQLDTPGWQFLQSIFGPVGGPGGQVFGPVWDNIGPIWDNIGPVWDNMEPTWDIS